MRTDDDETRRCVDACHTAKLGIVALSTAVVQILYAFGPGLLGILRDSSGGYGVPLAVCIALNLAASVVIMLRPRRH